MPLPEMFHSSQGIFSFPPPVLVGPGAQPDTPKIEAQHLTAQAEESFRDCEDNLVVHSSLELGVGMADDHQGFGVY